MPNLQLDGAASVFTVADVTRSADYFRDCLGFAVAFKHGDFYAGVERDNVIVHLHAAAQSPRAAGQSGLYIFVHDVDAIHDDVKARGAKIVKPPADYPYGMRDFDVRDPDGNWLFFGQQIKQPAPG